MKAPTNSKSPSKAEKYTKWTHANRMVGKPRMSCSEIAVAGIWAELKQTNARYRYTVFEYNNRQKVRTLKQYAKNT